MGSRALPPSVKAEQRSARALQGSSTLATAGTARLCPPSREICADFRGVVHRREERARTTQAAICGRPEPFQPLGICRRVPTGRISGFCPGTDAAGIGEEERGRPVPGAKAGASSVDEAEPGGWRLRPAGEEGGRIPSTRKHRVPALSPAALLEHGHGTRSGLPERGGCTQVLGPGGARAPPVAVHVSLHSCVFSTRQALRRGSRPVTLFNCRPDVAGGHRHQSEMDRFARAGPGPRPALRVKPAFTPRPLQPPPTHPRLPVACGNRDAEKAQNRGPENPARRRASAEVTSVPFPFACLPNEAAMGVNQDDSVKVV